MVEFSYVPSEHERRLANGARWIAYMRFFWVTGGLLVAAGAILSALAASGGSGTGLAVLATIAGGFLLVWPYMDTDRYYRAAVRVSRERHVTVSDAGVRLANTGMSLEIGWSRVRRVRETDTYWLLDVDSGRVVHLPKSAVPDADRAEVVHLLELAKDRAAVSGGGPSEGR